MQVYSIYIPHICRYISIFIYREIDFYGMLNQTEFGLHIHFFTKWNSVWCQINRNRNNAIKKWSEIGFV